MFFIVKAMIIAASRTRNKRLSLQLAFLVLFGQPIAGLIFSVFLNLNKNLSSIETFSILIVQYLIILLILRTQITDLKVRKWRTEIGSISNKIYHLAQFQVVLYCIISTFLFFFFLVLKF
jgi:hypothetical protein